MFYSCQDEEVLPVPLEDDKSGLTQATERKYQQGRKCGFIDDFCARDYFSFISEPPEKVFFSIIIGNDEYEGYPIKLSEDNIGFLIEYEGEQYVIHDQSDEDLNELSSAHNLPKELNIFLKANY